MQISGSFTKRALAASAIAIALFLGKPSTFAQAYQIDDGTAEDSIGLTNGGDVIALNSFATLPGLNTISSISIAWGASAFPDPSLVGLTYTVVLWSDPNNDGSPTDAVVLATAPGVITSQGANLFLTTLITPTTVLTSNFFVGFLITHAAGQFPASYDETAPNLPNRSFVAGGAAGTGDINNLNNNGLPPTATEAVGLPAGNWLIRADAIPEPSTYVLTGLGLLGMLGLRRFVRRTQLS